MSRYSKTSEDGRYELAYGHDHACGWFVQVWDTTEEDNGWDIPVVNLDETQTTAGNCSAEVIKTVASEHNIIITDEELSEAQSETPRCESKYQNFLDKIEAMASIPKGDA